MRKLVRKSRLSGFWRSVWRRYGRVVLDEAQIEWILKAKGRGMKNGHIAMWPAKQENYSDPTLNAIARVKTPPAEGPYK